MAGKYLQQRATLTFFQQLRRELMTFFLEIRNISGYITPLSVIVVLNGGDLQIVPLAINGNRFAWLVCREI